MKIKAIIIFVVAISVGFVYMFLHPVLLFDKYLKYKNFSIYYDSRMSDNKLKNLLNNVNKNLLKNKIDNLHETNNIYLCASRSKVMLLTLTSGDAFGYNLFFNKIILSKTILDSNKIHSYNQVYNQRTFTGVLTHELTHTYLKNTIGFIGYSIFPSWKNEGYCDYVANETSFPNELGISILIKKENNYSSSFLYFKNYLKVKYLLDIKKLSVHEFIENNIDENQLEHELMAWLESGKLNVRILLGP